MHRFRRNSNPRCAVLGVLFLILLSSHEVLIHARNINVHTQFLKNEFSSSIGPLHSLQKLGNNKYINQVFKDIHSKSEEAFVDDSIYFVEEAEKIVMENSLQKSSDSSTLSPLHAEAKEILDLRETLTNTFTFQNSPMLDDIKSLTPVSPSFLELPSRKQIDAHYSEITSFLEKVMTKVSRGGSKLEGALKTVEAFESRVNVTDYAWSAVFGLINGFFSGMASDFRDNYKSPLCQDGLRSIGLETKAVTHAFKKLWHTAKAEALKAIVSKTSRHKVKGSLKHFLRAIYKFIRAVSNYLWTCEATRPLVTFGFIILGAFALNLLLMSFSVLMPLTVLIKIVGMIAGLYFAAGFFLDTTKTLFGRIKEYRHGKCGAECKQGLVENVFELIGCAMEVVLLGGVTEIVKFSKSGAAAKGLKRLKIELHPTMADDLKVLANYAKSGKNHVKVAINSLDFKTKFTKKQGAWEKYNAKKMQLGKKPLSKKKWEVHYDNLLEARKMKKHYTMNPMDHAYSKYLKSFKSGRGKNKKIPLSRNEWNIKMKNMKMEKVKSSKFKNDPNVDAEAFAAASTSAAHTAGMTVLSGSTTRISGLRSLGQKAKIHIKSVGDAMDANDAKNEVTEEKFEPSSKWKRLVKQQMLRKAMKQRGLYEAKMQVWTKRVLSNINEYTAWNQRLGSVKSEAELEDEKEEHLENKYGIIGKCRGDVSGLCFDVRKSTCETGRKIIGNRCKGDKFIKCCPGAQIEAKAEKMGA
jgi:hypothetical protein